MNTITERGAAEDNMKVEAVMFLHFSLTGLTQSILRLILNISDCIRKEHELEVTDSRDIT